MKTCILAIHIDDKYYSKLCQCEEAIDICEMMNGESWSKEAALRVVTAGNVNIFDRKVGDFKEAGVFSHESARKLIDYAFLANASEIVCFESSDWASIPLLSSKIEEPQLRLQG